MHTQPHKHSNTGTGAVSHSTHALGEMRCLQPHPLLYMTTTSCMTHTLMHTHTRARARAEPYCVTQLMTNVSHTHSVHLSDTFLPMFMSFNRNTEDVKRVKHFTWQWILHRSGSKSVNRNLITWQQISHWEQISSSAVEESTPNRSL